MKMAYIQLKDKIAKNISQVWQYEKQTVPNGHTLNQSIMVYFTISTEILNPLQPPLRPFWKTSKPHYDIPSYIQVELDNA